ncbi:MAG: hypothetical protein P8N43_04230 [Alphaproteobacteria bacterium]|nr:hypothetical protein [Alphaproteobacteria bacterium]
MPWDQSSTTSAVGQRVDLIRRRRSAGFASLAAILKGLISVPAFSPVVEHQDCASARQSVLCTQ